MAKFPVDAPKAKVLKTLAALGFVLVREREHLALLRENPDGTRTPMTLPNHSRIKGSTLRTICTQAGMPRDEFYGLSMRHDVRVGLRARLRSVFCPKNGVV